MKMILWVKNDHDVNEAFIKARLIRVGEKHVHFYLDHLEPAAWGDL